MSFGGLFVFVTNFTHFQYSPCTFPKIFFVLFILFYLLHNLTQIFSNKRSLTQGMNRCLHITANLAKLPNFKLYLKAKKKPTKTFNDSRTQKNCLTAMKIVFLHQQGNSHRAISWKADKWRTKEVAGLKLYLQLITQEVRVGMSLSLYLGYLSTQ